MRNEKQMRLDEVYASYQDVLEKEECVDLKALAVTGKDLISWGMNPGKELGDMLQKLLSVVIEEPQKNQKEILKEICLTALYKPMDNKE